MRKFGAFGGDNGSSAARSAWQQTGDENVYVADSLNHRIQQFDATGPGPYVTHLGKWGSFGSGDGQFNGPVGVAVGGNGHVFVADQGNHRVQEFIATGGFVRTWGSLGSSTGQLNLPSGVAAGGNGHVYVADSGNHRIARVLPL